MIGAQLSSIVENADLKRTFVCSSCNKDFKIRGINFHDSNICFYNLANSNDPFREFQHVSGIDVRVDDDRPKWEDEDKLK